MPAPDQPNTGPAAEARRRIGDRKAAERLTARGWLLVPPGRADQLSPELRAELDQLQKGVEQRTP